MSKNLAVPIRGEYSRKKVALKPGHSSIDWAKFKIQVPARSQLKVSADELKKHATINDAWTAISGVVYDITPFIDYHPGGPEEIMRAAGEDATELFNSIHSWISVSRMLDTCVVGQLI